MNTRSRASGERSSGSCDDLPPLDYTPPPSGDVEHFRSALKRARARLNEMERLRDRQRITFSDRYPLREYNPSQVNEDDSVEPRAMEPRSADDINNRNDTNREVDL